MDIIDGNRTKILVLSSGIVTVLILSLMIIPNPIQASHIVIFEEDFESGWGEWYTTNGIWQIGAPTAGPGGCPSGENCAGTILGEKYPDYTDSRLISPPVQLPYVTEGDILELRFWHYFDYFYSPDYGQVEVSIYNESQESQEPWENITEHFTWKSVIWTPIHVNLLPFEGKWIRFAFLHTADGTGHEYGWYIDNITIIAPLIVPTDTIVKINPLLTYNEIYAGNGFTLFIEVDPAEPIAGVQFDLTFDLTLFQAGSVHEGSLFYGSSTYFNPGIVDNINGTITDVYVVITTPGDNVIHSGEAVYVNFTAPLDANGTSWFNLSNVVVGQPNGSPVPVIIENASVTVLPNEPWDVNNDDSVNILDLILIGQDWGEAGPPCWISADVNCDGVVNILDMILVGQHWTG